MDQLGIQGTDQRSYFPFPSEPVSTKPPAAFCFAVRGLYSADWKGACRPDCNHEHDEVVSGLLAALQRTVSLPPNPALAGLAKRTLAEIARIQGTVELGQISDFVAMRFRLAPDELMGKSRVQRVAVVRQIAMYLCRKLTDSSFPAVGEHFHRDHSTAVHNVALIQSRIDHDPAFARTILRIEHELVVSSTPVAVAAA
jgi:hypothetical protein